MADVTRASSSSQPCFSACAQASCTAWSSAFSPSLESIPSSPDVLGQPQDRPVVVHGRGVRAGVGVDHQQVHGVRADVQHSEPHGASLPGRRPAARPGGLTLAGCPSDPPAEVPLDFAREWVEFTDPGDPDHRIRADLTWLTSAWTCIYGRGCAGVVEGRPDDGCCSHGAFFTDEDDLARVTAAVGRLTDDDWQLAAEGRASWTEEDAADDDEAGRPVAAHPHGRRRLRVPQPARPPRREGCALHRMALRTGVHPLTTKPDVCWQLPVRREQEHVERPDGTTVLVTSIGEFDRRGWGPGGHDLHWWCTGSPAAHVSPEPLVDTYGRRADRAARARPRTPSYAG